MELMEVALSRPSFDALVKQLVYIEDRKHQMLDDFNHLPLEKQNQLQKVITSYHEQLSELIRRVVISDQVGNKVPFAVINSRVTLKNLQSQDHLIVKLVTPFASRRERLSGMQQASCLSPLGASLLLTRSGDQISVQTPAGLQEYVVMEIELI